MVSRNGERAFGARGGFARSVSGFVWIRRFGTDSVGFEVFETVIHETSVTSLISIRSRAIDELLFREISECTLTYGIPGFTSSDGGESPARSTLSLVFNFLDFSFGNPIDISDKFVGFVSNNFFSFCGFESKIDGFEFFIGQISEEVDGLGIGLGFVGVVGVD